MEVVGLKAFEKNDGETTENAVFGTFISLKCLNLIPGNPYSSLEFLKV
tara:strand:+ start:171 stop:314 length:144 start_codon:yes stop_codon:yes gene_type:complete